MRRLLLLPVVLAGCARAAPDPAPGPTDMTMDRAIEAGRLTYEMERPEAAVSEYRAALTRAQARDDPAAIGDLGFDLAVAEPPSQCARPRPRRRAGDADRASNAAGPNRFRPCSSPKRPRSIVPARRRRPTKWRSASRRARMRDTARRATFLRGLIADERGDEAGLAAATGRLEAAPASSPQADRAEFGGAAGAEAREPRAGPPGGGNGRFLAPGGDRLMRRRARSCRFRAKRRAHRRPGSGRGPFPARRTQCRGARRRR